MLKYEVMIKNGLWRAKENVKENVKEQLLDSDNSYQKHCFISKQYVGSDFL